MSQKHLGVPDAFPNMWHTDTDTLLWHRTRSMRSVFPGIVFLIDYNRHALGLRRGVIGHDRHRAGLCRRRPQTIPTVLLNKLVRRIRARLYGNHLVRVCADATSAVSS